MGISTGGDRNGVKSEINVTPLVDIVLVLLIIFLVLTPIKMRHISIEVPREIDQENEIVVDSKVITVKINYGPSYTLSDGSEESELASRFELARTLRPILERKRTEKVVFVDVADDVPYKDAVEAMDTIKGTGAEKVALKFKKDEQTQ